MNNQSNWFEVEGNLGSFIIDGCTFTNNYVGLHVNNVLVQNCTITNNDYGIVPFNNTTSIINYNNIYDNQISDVYVETGGDEIDFNYNYWGEETTNEMNEGGNPKDIEKFYDYFDNNGLAMINYAGWIGGNDDWSQGYTADVMLTDSLWNDIGNEYPAMTENIYVEVYDPDESGLIEVEFTSNSDEDSETVFLYEVDEGLFRGSIAVDFVGFELLSDNDRDRLLPSKINELKLLYPDWEDKRLQSKARSELVKEAINKSVVSSLNCVEEVYLAERLISLNDWADKVKFARTGGEANALAIRIARAAIKKEKVAFCGYHGWHDWYLAANLKSKKSLDEHLIKGLNPLGVPKSLLKSSFGFTYGNYNKLEKLVNEKNIGVIKMEVCRNTQPNIKFLKQVRNLATKKNIILIFDECTTGFRQNFGGIYKSTGVTPDIAIFGKALGNGYPITAVIGKEEIMSAAKNSFMSSTFWSERIGPVAALKTLEIMEKNKSWITITKLGNNLISIWKKLALRHKIKIAITGIPSLAKFSINSKNSQAYKTYITQQMLEKGFLASNAVYLSISHNKNIFRKYETVLDKIFYDISLCEKGLISINEILKYPVSHLPFERFN